MSLVHATAIERNYRNAVVETVPNARLCRQTFALPMTGTTELFLCVRRALQFGRERPLRFATRLFAAGSPCAFLPERL